MAHGKELCVSFGGVFVDLFVVEARGTWSDVVLLTHLEVLSEVLVSAPPVEVDSLNTLVSANLMEVRVTNVVLFVVIRHWSWVHWVRMRVINLTNSVPPASNHCVLLRLNLDGDPVVLEQHVNHVNVQKAHSVLSAENLGLPVHVTNWVFHKSTDVLESSPFLSLISWLFSALDELCKIAISVSG